MMYDYDFSGSGGRCNICDPVVYFTSAKNAQTHIRGIKHQVELQEATYVEHRPPHYIQTTVNPEPRPRNRSHVYIPQSYGFGNHLDIRSLNYIYNNSSSPPNMRLKPSYPDQLNMYAEPKYPKVQTTDTNKDYSDAHSKTSNQCYHTTKRNYNRTRQHSGETRRSTQWLHCSLCDVNVNSEERAQVHQMGKRHKQKLAALKVREQCTSFARPIGSEKQATETVPKYSWSSQSGQTNDIFKENRAIMNEAQILIDNIQSMSNFQTVTN